MNTNSQEKIDTPQGRSAYWLQSLRVKLTLYHIIFMLILAASTILALFYIEDKFLIEQGQNYTQQLGNRIVAELGQRISQTETLTQSLARLGETLTKKDSIYKSTIPAVIDFQGDDRIAGGGIWPEPFQYDPQLARRSFFWARQKNSQLQYFDDYNDVNGPGYHNEEWYVPAQFLKSQQVYWSKSYMDPYSYEPMVTCTAPMYKNGEFSGTSTIDLKLAGLDEFFSEKAKAVNGYIFALDRNNKLLSFPNLKIAKRYRTDEKGNTSEEFLMFDELAKNKPEFTQLHLAVKQINEGLKNKVKNPHSSKQAELIAKSSYQIELDEAELITAMLSLKPQSLEKHLLNQNDPILNKKVMYSVFKMPETCWKIIVVTPNETVNAFANKVTYTILYIIIILELIVLLAMLYIFSRTVTTPLTKMCDQLREEGEDAQLNEDRNDELGLLSYEINKRTKQVKEAINKLKESNLDLEKRVLDRTTEIEQALTQLEDARSNAENANNSKSLFLANMSHEIRTPMNAILGYTDILDTKISDPKLKKNLATIKASGRTLLNLINDILDLSKVEAGKIDLHYEAIKSKRLFKNIHRQFRDSAERKGIKLKLIIDAELPDAIFIDEHRVSQILTNIIGNAIKFTDQGSVTLKVDCYDTDSGLLIFSVTDTGVGIKECDIDNIFDNFNQLNQDYTSHVSGTGLGLAITRKLALLMDGDIVVESEFNKGTTFTVTLNNIEPIYPEKNQVIVEENYIFEKATVLIVDDIAENRRLLSSYLEEFPLSIYQAENGQEAVDLCEQQHFDLILMDLKMPIMDGYTAAKLIKAQRKIPVIVITAAALTSTEKEIRCLCEGYLRKPVNQAELLKELGKYIQHQVAKVSVDKIGQETLNSKKILSFLKGFLKEIDQAAINLEIIQLKKLIVQLEKLNNDYPCQIFDEWFSSLEEEFHSFNMKDVGKILLSYPDIIQQLESL